MGVAEDGRAEAEEGFVKDDGVNEGSVGEVDLREGVVETSEGVWRRRAREGSGRRLSLVFILKMMAVIGLGRYGSPRTVVRKLNTRFQ